MHKTRKRVLMGLFVIILVVVFNQMFFKKTQGDPNFTNVGAKNASEAAVSSTEDKVEESVSLSMVGDMLLHAPVTKSGLLANGKRNYDHLFAHVKEDIEGSDIAIVNEEVILGGSQLGLTGYPAFNGPFEVADSIAEAGFNVVLHATNHTLDKGKVGMANCLKYWNTRYPYIKIVGMYSSQSDQDHVTVYEKGNLRVAILNYTYGTNGIPVPKDMPYAVNILSEKKVRADIKKAKKEADFVVMCPHWGTEYYTGISEQQKKWAKIFLEEGVDLVIGTHPHVIGPVEWMKDDNGHKMLVYYSLGNFINATNAHKPGVAKQMVGTMAQVNIVKKTSGNVEIGEYRAIPLITHWPLTAADKITTYKYSDYTEELANKSRVKSLDSKFSYEYIKSFAKEVLGDAMKIQ